MGGNYRQLPHGILTAGTGVRRPEHRLPDKVDLDSPALDVMTDLHLVSAVSVDAHTHIDEARQHMISGAVRLLFVLNAQQQIVGILTARDLDGDKAMRYLGQHGGTRADLTVGQLMTPQRRVEVLHLRDVAQARVGDVVTTLKRMGRQHALVTEEEGSGTTCVRGVLSTTAIARQLGRDIDTSDYAASFAALEAALA